MWPELLHNLLGMGVDRALVRAFGFFSFGVVALSAGGAGIVAMVSGNSEVILLFMPLLFGYGVVVLTLWVGLALYHRVRSKILSRNSQLGG